MADWWLPVAKHPSEKPGLLLVANWDSDVGYAWWLMESYWAALAEDYQTQMTAILAYPSISKLPEVIEKAPVSPMVVDFSRFSPGLLWTQLRFLRRHRIQVMYLSDRAPRHWIYLLYRLAGVRRILVHDHTPGNSPHRYKAGDQDAYEPYSRLHRRRMHWRDRIHPGALRSGWVCSRAQMLCRG